MHDFPVSDIEQCAGWLRESSACVAFTGAGISTESGIPDFRSPGGVWSRSQPVLFQDFLQDEDARVEYWRQKCESHEDFARAEPNPGHRVLANWDARHLLRGVITQNIDGLHQMAGSQHVLELHGTARRVACLECQADWEASAWVEEFRASGNAPLCPECGAWLKHATISFGQALPENVLNEALILSQSADLFFAIGSSLVVEPAASLPRLAARQGARLVIINRDPTPLDETASMVFHHGAGEVLTAIDMAFNDA